ncbi:hypothetical protein CBL_03495 [Carabus blaptoides fortunei]
MATYTTTWTPCTDLPTMQQQCATQLVGAVMYAFRLIALAPAVLKAKAQCSSLGQAGANDEDSLPGRRSRSPPHTGAKSDCGFSRARYHNKSRKWGTSRELPPSTAEPTNQPFASCHRLRESKYLHPFCKRIIVLYEK